MKELFEKYASEVCIDGVYVDVMYEGPFLAALTEYGAKLYAENTHLHALVKDAVERAQKAESKIKGD